MVFGVSLPYLVESAASIAIGAAIEVSNRAALDRTGVVTSGWLARTIGAECLLVAVGLVVAFIAAAAWAAGIWAITEEAATGRSVRLQDAFRFGFSRGLRMWGWSLLVGLIVGIGSVCCVLPGIYLALGSALFGFVVVFERGLNPIDRSFRLSREWFWPSIGRVAFSMLPLVGYFVISWAVALASVAGSAAIGTLHPATDVGWYVQQGVVALLEAAVLGPVCTAVLVGLFVTYAELRAREAPLSTLVLRASM